MKYKLKYRINGSLFRRTFNTSVERDDYAAILIHNGISVTMTGRKP